MLVIVMRGLFFLVMVVVFFLVVGCSSAVNLSYGEICDVSKMVGGLYCPGG